MTTLLAMGFRAADAAPPEWLVTGRNGVVATDSAEASEAGLEILQKGGNAIDAAVAVSFALGVTRPYSTGLGGGGFMVARLADGRIVVQDFREMAPAAASPGMYIEAGRNNPKAPSPSEFGHLAVGVPGVVAGRCEALTKFGTMPLVEVVKPAVRLAEKGYLVDDDFVVATKEVRDAYEKHPALKKSCPFVYRTFLQNGRLFSSGDRLIQPELGRLIREIGVHGPSFFYQGPVARAIAREMREHGGIVTEADLAGYRVLERTPLRCDYRGYSLIGLPPPSSGGTALLETLNILERFDLPSWSRKDRVQVLHYRIEAMKHAFADRARWLGDSDFAKVPIERLISDSYAGTLASRIQSDRPTELPTYGSETIPDDAGTSHFCVVDRFGNVVSSSETINTFFGSLAAVEEWGLVLNNEMDDFAAEPGKPNAYGLIQSERNAVEPGKRPLSSTSPTIVMKDNQPVLLLGASGGPRIISSVLHVMLNVLDDGMSLEAAIQSSRPHHQWQPDEIYFDSSATEEQKNSLRRKGHRISEKRKTGIVQAILRTEDGWVGASDPRKGGRPAGY